jgi:hypothetical protein
MKNTCVVLSAMLALLAFNPAMAKESREDQQTRLDQACELARDKKLVPMRAQFVEECVANKEKSSREKCVTFYADYGNRMGGRAPLFYDLPECVTAFDYSRSDRRSD